jgi:hypothetical protein
MKRFLLPFLVLNLLMAGGIAAIVLVLLNGFDESVPMRERKLIVMTYGYSAAIALGLLASAAFLLLNHTRGRLVPRTEPRRTYKSS